MTMTQRIWGFDWRSAILAAPFAILLAMLFNAAIDRAPPIVYIEARAMQRSVQAGGQLEVRFDVDRKRICQILNINRYVRDKDGVDHSVASYTANTATRPGRETYDRTITVPEAVPAGRAAYFIRLRYACNIIHNLGWPITVTTPMVPFVVEPQPADFYAPAVQSWTTPPSVGE